MLLGEFRHSLDSKNRVFLPAKWREELGDRVFITRGLDKCLYLMAQPEFEEMRRKIDERALEDPGARAYSRVFFAKASEEQVDAQGRITIPANLKLAAGLDKEVVLAGTSTRGEIWDRAGFDAYQEEAMAKYEELAQGLL